MDLTRHCFDVRRIFSDSALSSPQWCDQGLDDNLGLGYLDGPAEACLELEKMRKVLLLATAVAMIPWVLPGREVDQEDFKGRYLRNLPGYEGTRYYWGGEGSRGIDCFGLPRRTYRDALLWYGVQTLNGKALRSWAEQWWLDVSAKALGVATGIILFRLMLREQFDQCPTPRWNQETLPLRMAGLVFSFISEKTNGFRLIQVWSKL